MSGAYTNGKRYILGIYFMCYIVNEGIMVDNNVVLY